MLPLHAATAIVLSACSFGIGYGIGYLKREKPKTVYVSVPASSAGPQPTPFNPPSDDKT